METMLAVVAYGVLTALSLLFAGALDLFYNNTKWQASRKVIGLLLFGWIIMIIFIMGLILYVIIGVLNVIFGFDEEGKRD